MYNFRNSMLLHGAKSEPRFKVSAPLLILIAFAMFYVSQLFASVPVSIVGGVLAAIAMSKNGMISDEGEILADSEEMIDLLTSVMSTDIVTLISLFATVFMIVVPIVWCKVAEKRTVASMGFVRKGAIPQYALGMLVGLMMFSIVYLICVGTKAISFEGFNGTINVSGLLLFFLAFLVQGAAEEVLIRGFLMLSLGRASTVFNAVLSSSVLFAFLHSANSGISLLAFLNIALFGVFISLYMLRTNNIWGACAIHSIWNFAQGNLFGCLVSGMNVNSSLFISESDIARKITNGGDFGPEGGLAVTIVLLIAVMCVVYIPALKRTDSADEGRKSNTEKEDFKD